MKRVEDCRTYHRLLVIRIKFALVRYQQQKNIPKHRKEKNKKGKFKLTVAEERINQRTVKKKI